MARPKDPKDMQRPARREGDVIRALVGCPLCRLDPELGAGAQLRVVAYRRNTVRLACPLCGLRFSVGRRDLAEAIGRNPASYRNAMALTVWNRHEL